MGATGAPQGGTSDLGRVVPRAAVLFVCMGNICRSPLAEGVFRTHVANAGLLDRVNIDSAGTHESQAGQPPDPRAISVARRHGYDLPPHRARKVGTPDFGRFDWILAMDKDNLEVLQALRPLAYRGHLGLLLSMARESSVIEVPDPYFGGPRDFEHVIHLVERGAEALLNAIRERLSISESS
jgi:protein-tyrosine phosphatase